MSENHEVSRLTGKLVWETDNKPLTRFQNALQRMSKLMTEVGNKATALQGKLNRLSKKLSALQSELNDTSVSVKAGSTNGFIQMSRKAEELQKKLQLRLGVTPAKEKAKLDAEIRRSAERELKMETRIAQTRRAIFAQELAGQKLQFANTRENAFLQTAGLKQQQEMATLQAKQQRAEQAKLQTQQQSLKVERTLVENKARALRGEQLLAQQQARTVMLQQRQVAGLTTMQKLELSLSEQRKRNQRAAEKYAQSQLAQQVRSERQAEKHQNSQQRFQWATARQSAWEASRNKPEAPTGFLGLGTAGLALGGLSAGLVGIVAAVNALGARLDKRQEAASDSQNYSNIFQQIGGRNLANADFAQESFAALTDKFGMANNSETAADFRQFMLSEQARGVSMSKALDKFAAQLGSFRASGMTKVQQQRAVTQLQQVRSIGYASTEDVKTFAESAPLIKEAIVQAWGQRTKFKGPNLEGSFMKAIPNGGVTRDDFESGMALFVKQQSSTLIRQMASIDAQQQRLENTQYLQDQNINSSPELVDAIGKRIAAENELTKSLAPLREASEKLDAAFMTLVAKFLTWTFGKDATPQDAAKKIDGLSPEKPDIDVNAMTGAELPDNKPVPDALYGWLGKLFTGSPTLPADEGPADQTGVWNPLPLRMPVPMSGADITARNRRVGGSSNADGQSSVANNVVNNNNPTINLTTNITTQPGADGDEIARTLQKDFYPDFEKRIIDKLSFHQKEVE